MDQLCLLQSWVLSSQFWSSTALEILIGLLKGKALRGASPMDVSNKRAKTMSFLFFFLVCFPFNQSDDINGMIIKAH